MTTTERTASPLAQVAAAIAIALILMWIAATFLAGVLLYYEGAAEPWYMTVGAIVWLVYTGASWFGSVAMWAVSERMR